MFEKASRLKLRFAINGSCTSEDLWDFSKETLADFEVKLQESIEKQGKSNRFARKNNKLAVEELKLSIVSHIIDVKIAEEEESINTTIKKQELQKALEIRNRVNQSSLEEKISKMTDEEFNTYTASLK